MLNQLYRELQRLKNPEKAKIIARFFKTGKGEYGEGDIFLGIMVPNSRKMAIKYQELPFEDIKKLLQSKIHEERLIALLILIHNFQKEATQVQRKIFDFYLQSTIYINKWDLVDLSADRIVGRYLLNKPKKILVKLARSKNIWERRIAIIATYQFIKNGVFGETLRIAEILLYDKHDLIQKAVGWMLREVGKRDQKAEEDFLKKYYQKMPRTALRYAIERFDAKSRSYYLART